jgi:hypothetical protein
VTKLINDAGMDTKVAQDVKNYFKGYSIGGVELYSSGSMMEFLNNPSYDTKFTTEGANIFAKSGNEEVRILKLNLLSSKRESAVKSVPVKRLFEFKYLDYKKFKIQDIVRFVDYFVHMGFLTVWQSEAGASLRISNYEMMNLCESKLFVKEDLGASLYTLLSNLRVKLDETFAKFVADLVTGITPYISKFDPNEAIFHALISTLAFLKDSRFVIGNEKKSGSGYYGTVFRPVGDNPKLPVILHEYKYLFDPKETAIVVAIEVALWQIFAKRYLESAWKQLNYGIPVADSKIIIRGIVAFVRPNLFNVEFAESMFTVDEAKSLCFALCAVVEQFKQDFHEIDKLISFLANTCCNYVSTLQPATLRRGVVSIVYDMIKSNFTFPQTLLHSLNKNVRKKKAEAEKRKKKRKLEEVPEQAVEESG